MLYAGPRNLEANSLISGLNELVDTISPGRTVVEDSAATRHVFCNSRKVYRKIASNFTKFVLDMSRDIRRIRQIGYFFLLIVLLIIVAIFLLIVFWKAEVQRTGFTTAKFYKNIFS